MRTETAIKYLRDWRQWVVDQSGDETFKGRDKVEHLFYHLSYIIHGESDLQDYVDEDADGSDFIDKAGEHYNDRPVKKFLLKMIDYSIEELRTFPRSTVHLVGFKAPGPIKNYARRCKACGEKFQATRSDRKFCSAACQKRAKRREKKSPDVHGNESTDSGQGPIIPGCANSSDSPDRPA